MLLSAHSLQCEDSCKYLVSDGGDEGSRNETLAAMYKETVILQRRPAELNCVSVGQPQPAFFYLGKIMWGTDAALQNSQRGNPFGIWSQVSRLVSLQLNQTGKFPNMLHAAGQSGSQANACMRIFKFKLRLNVKNVTPINHFISTTSNKINFTIGSLSRNFIIYDQK